MAFTDRMKSARLKKGLTQEQLALVIGVAKPTYNGYEKGKSEPNMLMLTKIMSALDVDANYLFQDEVRIMHDSLATPDEMENIIKKYRALDGHGKKMIDIVLEEESRRMEEDQEPEESSVISLPRFWNRPSAGNGNELGDGDHDTISVPDTLTARIASYALTVSGHSMEPEISDGETVLVKSQDSFEEGDIVVFALNDQSYIKRAGADRFESINPDYEDVTPGEDDSLHIFGVVVGKI